MLDKQRVFDAAQQELSNKIELLQRAFNDLKSALTSESKSTAGDKHETGRAMAQLEQEKLSGQLSQTISLRDALSQIDPTKLLDTVQFGSLVETSNGYFFFSIGLGKIDLHEDSVFCLTATTPLGQQMLGKKAGDSIQLNGNTIEIKAVT